MEDIKRRLLDRGYNRLAKRCEDAEDLAAANFSRILNQLEVHIRETVENRFAAMQSEDHIIAQSWREWMGREVSAPDRFLIENFRVPQRVFERYYQLKKETE